jgi:hypothetical protein
MTSEISGFHGGEYEDDCLLGCCAVFTDVSEVLTVFIIRTIALMIDAASASETSVNFY